MGKVPIWSLPQQAYRQESRTFTDPAHPEHPVTLTLRELKDPIARAGVQERAQELIEEYVTGKLGEDGELLLNEDKEPVQEPLPYVAPDSTVIRLNRRMCAALAVLEGMQVGPETERYSFDELVGLARRMPDAWEEISIWANSFRPRKGELGNDSRANGDTSSAPPVTSEASTPA